MKAVAATGGEAKILQPITVDGGGHKIPTLLRTEDGMMGESEEKCGESSPNFRELRPSENVSSVSIKTQRTHLSCVQPEKRTAAVNAQSGRRDLTRRGLERGQKTRKGKGACSKAGAFWESHRTAIPVVQRTVKWPVISTCTNAMTGQKKKPKRLKTDVPVLLRIRFRR